MAPCIQHLGTPAQLTNALCLAVCVLSALCAVFVHVSVTSSARHEYIHCTDEEPEAECGHTLSKVTQPTCGSVCFTPSGLPAPLTLLFTRLLIWQ